MARKIDPPIRVITYTEMFEALRTGGKVMSEPPSLELLMHLQRQMLSEMAEFRNQLMALTEIWMRIDASIHELNRLRCGGKRRGQTRGQTEA